MTAFLIVVGAFVVITMISEWVENQPLGERKVIRMLSPEWMEGRIQYFISASMNNPYRPNTQRYIDYEGGYEYSREACGNSETVVNWRAIHAMRNPAYLPFNKY